jgi:chaperone modulatory protein CbpM
MKQEEMIDAQEFCIHHHVEYTFIQIMDESGLIRIETIEQKQYIPLDELARVEMFARFHSDLGLNPEALETVSHLLDKLKEMKQEIVKLSNRLQLYE